MSRRFWPRPTSGRRRCPIRDFYIGEHPPFLEPGQGRKRRRSRSISGVPSAWPAGSYRKRAIVHGGEGTSPPRERTWGAGLGNTPVAFIMSAESRGKSTGQGLASARCFFIFGRSIRAYAGRLRGRRFAPTRHSSGVRSTYRDE